MLEKSFSWTIRRDCCECNVTCDSMETWLFFLTEKSELSLSMNPNDYQLWRQPPELPISTTFNSHKHSKVFFAFLFLRLPPWENYLKSWEWSVVLPGHESRWIFKKQTRNITQPANLRHRDSAPSRWVLNNDTNRLRVFVDWSCVSRDSDENKRLSSHTKHFSVSHAISIHHVVFSRHLPQNTHFACNCFSTREKSFPPSRLRTQLSISPNQIFNSLFERLSENRISVSAHRGEPAKGSIVTVTLRGQGWREKPFNSHAADKNCPQISSLKLPI